MKTLASHPGASVFRSTIVIILILICIVFFFTFTDKLGQQAEEVAKDQVIAEMKQALAMMLYDYAIKGQLADLSQFDRENPFVPLAIYRELPKNYRGTISGSSEIGEFGWYFDINLRETIYVFSSGNNPSQRFVMKFKFEDQDGNGIYNSGDIGYLELGKA